MARQSQKLEALPEYASSAPYVHRATGQGAQAFQLDRKAIGTRPKADDRRPVVLRIILPDYRDADGKLIGEGGSVSGWDRDWLVKRGDVWTSVDPETFEREYEAKK